MATIQIREVPEDAYEVLRRRARAAGQSIQSYMRDQVVELASRPSKAEAVRVVEDVLRRRGPEAGPSVEEVVADVVAGRAER